MVVGRWREGEQGETTQDGGDAGCFSNVGGEMVGGEGGQGQGAQGEVEECGVCVLSVLLERGEGRVRWIGKVLLARGYES